MPKLSSPHVSRRATLAGIAGSAVLVAYPSVLLAHDVPTNPVFHHGVASGDPDETSVVLWTRLTCDGNAQVMWEISDSPDFRSVVQSGEFETGPERDHTVKLLATALQPGQTYYYRFRKDGIESPVGRARTLPTGHIESLGIALAACSNYAFGFFNAYDAIAKDADVDFVLHTGDYIYEYGADGWGGDVAHRIGRVHEPANEIVSLADYRRRHAQYKSDAGAQAMHGAHTLLACWDDHESANNPWTGGAQNHQPEKEGNWADRRAASIRAYFEWMPVREPEWLAVKGRERMQFWRSYSFGDLATLCTLETRHTARAKQIDYSEWASRIHSREDVERFRRKVLGEPDRRMLAPELETDLAASLSHSVKQGQPWRLIGNPMPIARMEVPDLVGLGLLPDPLAAFTTDGKLDTGKAMSDPAGALAWKGKWNLPFYPDTWDGYPWAREQLYALSRKTGAGDLVFLSGDSHSFWANRLADDAGRPAGIEFGTAGITSPGDFVADGFGPELSRELDKAFADHVAEVVWTDNMHQGYVRVEFGHEASAATFIAVDALESRDYRVNVIKRFAFGRKSGSVDFL